MPATEKEADIGGLPDLNLMDMLAVADEDKTELDKVLELLLDPKNIAHNTDLTTSEITAFSVLGTLAKRHNLEVLKDFLAENLVLRVSKRRAGRKEWVKIVARHLEREPEDEMPGGMGRFLRRRR